MRQVDRKFIENGAQFRTVTLIDCKRKTLSMKEIVGYCYNMRHTGYLTVALMNSHDCIGKKCPFFERFEDYPYWVKEANRSKEKERKRQKREDELDMQRKQEQKLSRLHSTAQEIARESGFPIIITRVTQSSSGRRPEYIVNYVSDARYNDYHPYFDLAIQLSQIERGRYVLRHVKLPDGRYATIEDWEDRPENKQKEC